MKKGLLLIFMVLMTITLSAQEQKEVITGAGYVNDVYYSLENGFVDDAAMKNWDIAFTTETYSASILANNGAGVELYTYPTGTIDDWATLDTTGMTWRPMYNSLETLDEGAFNYNATGHPDYGWGEYGGMGSLTGDSLYVIKTTGGSYKKLAIIEKSYESDTTGAIIGSIYDIKYANLDGSDEQSIAIITTDYTDMNFAYYSIDSMKVVDREPVSEEWDLLFTKFSDYVNYSPFYNVTGILTNEGHVEALEVRESGLDQSTFMSYEESAFSSNIGIIGGDWKEFDFSTGYVLNDTVVYFIKDYSNWDSGNKSFQDSVYYKLYFTGFTGMSQGKYTFMQERLSIVSTGYPGRVQLLEVYPNPASDHLNLVFDHVGETRISIIDINGRTVSSSMHHAGGFSNLTLDIAGLNSGLFFVKVDTRNGSQVTRFMKE